ncbi:MAG: sensor histidine kinase [Aldersonia sp.]|nr:sensor histidine kinase [Aldersonia sp.]
MLLRRFIPRCGLPSTRWSTAPARSWRASASATRSTSGARRSSLGHSTNVVSTTTSRPIRAPATVSLTSCPLSRYFALPVWGTTRRPPTTRGGGCSRSSAHTCATPDRSQELPDRTDRSRTRASGGTGLGLSIVAAIVDAHGGTVAVDSTPGIGTTFAVTLPRGRAVQSATLSE